MMGMKYDNSYCQLLNDTIEVCIY